MIKDKRVTLRISSETFNKLSLIEKEMDKPMSSIVRNFIVSALALPEHEVNKKAVFTTISNLQKKVDNLESKLRKIIEVIND
jgi:hypothetical protein